MPIHHDQPSSSKQQQQQQQQQQQRRSTLQNKKASGNKIFIGGAISAWHCTTPRTISAKPDLKL
jgi:hypothetical protein